MEFNDFIKIGSKFVGPGHPCFIIAEAGVNHDGDLRKAKKLVDIAKEANADIVKFQTFTAEKLASKDAGLATYHKKGAVSEKENLKQLLKRLELNKTQHRKLFDYAHTKNIKIFSTPFDEENADFLEELGVDVFKIASFSLTNYSLLEHIAKKEYPIILSTGLHTLGEIEEAIDVIYSTGNKQLALLHCISHYPIKPEDANLRVMNTLRDAFQVPVGYSDHTTGTDVTLASVALGANIVEKHFTFDTKAFGVDHDASIGPQELKYMVKGIRNVETSLGSSVKTIPDIEKEIQKVHRPSIVSSAYIPAETTITKEMLAIKKPGTGIHPRNISWIIGRKTKREIGGDRLIKKEYLF